MKIIDLSAELKHHMVRFPSAYLPEVSVVPAATHDKECRSAQIVTFGTHVSTHIDAPFHVDPQGKTVEQIPLDRLAGPALRIKLQGNDKHNPITEEQLRKALGTRRPRRLILETGWAKKTWGTKEYFVEGPHLTREATRVLGDIRELELIGMDFPNVDSKAETVPGMRAPNHHILLGRDMVLLENLLRLDEVTEDEFFLVCAPPALVGGDGCPCRAMAMFPIRDLPSWK